MTEPNKNASKEKSFLHRVLDKSKRGKIEVKLYLLVVVCFLAHVYRKGDYSASIFDAKIAAQLVWGSLVFWLLVGIYWGFWSIYTESSQKLGKHFPDETSKEIMFIANGLRRRARFLAGASYTVLICILWVLWYGYAIFSEAEQKNHDYVVERNQHVITRYTNALAVAEELKHRIEERTKSPIIVLENLTFDSPLCPTEKISPNCDKVTGALSSGKCDIACLQSEHIRFRELAKAYETQSRDKSSEKNIESVLLGMTTKVGSAALLFFSIFLLVSLYRYTSRLSVFYHSRADLLHLFDPKDVKTIEKFAGVYVPDWVEFGSKNTESVYERVFDRVFPKSVLSKLGTKKKLKTENTNPQD